MMMLMKIYHPEEVVAVVAVVAVEGVSKDLLLLPKLQKFRRLWLRAQTNARR